MKLQQVFHIDRMSLHDMSGLQLVLYGLDRVCAWIYALLHSKARGACPVCGRWFAAQERAKTDVMDSLHSGYMVCWRCGGEAKRQNERKYGGLRETYIVLSDGRKIPGPIVRM